ncbi:hypothetical protein [Nocardia yamanashiensis]|uniref:hypothetical protein n=1 Tax=Nocardia yamanashiensis TaxID=209247 RepID=UPI000AFD3723|nr:hypothetical protein [Nocardia yamanashiensis]
MSHETLSRTNIQALYRHMPEQPYNWGAKTSVVGLPPRQTTSLDIPEEWVAPQLKRLLQPYTGYEETTQILQRGQFALVKAEDLQAQRFPNTFICPKCGAFRHVQLREQPPACPRGCGQQLRQFPWAEVHECGHLAEIKPPKCEKCHRTTAMRLRNTASFRTAEWWWWCDCGQRSGRAVANWCATCQKGRVELRRVPRAELHYPQQITVLNPPSRADYSSLANDQIHRAAVAQCIGKLPEGLEGLRIAGGTSGDDAVSKFHELAVTMGLEPGDPMYDGLLARAEKSRADTPAWAEAIESLRRSPEVIDALGEECIQLALTRAAPAPVTSAQLLSVERGRALEATYAEHPDLLRKYGLSEVTLLPKLPIAYLIAGYTRLSPKAKLVTPYREVLPRFRFFDDKKSNRFPVYGIRTETEGLLFELDQLEVIRWLVDSGMIDDPGVTTIAQARKWMFEVLTPVTDIFNPPGDAVTEAVLGLVHSMSHRVMKSLATRCGLNADSLAEYLFPVNCAFLVYANTRSEFTLGGLEHVYRYDLDDALRELDVEARCVFDPPCRETFGGACAACLHVFEGACARFNTALDRNLLFGTVYSDDGPVAPNPHGYGDVRWRAYWNH